MTNPWRAFRNSQLVHATGEYRRNLKLLSGIVAVVAVPVALLSTYAVDPTVDSSLSAYLTFAQMIMNSALVYAVIRLSSQDTLTIKKAYFEGSAPLVRLILTSLLLVLIGLLLFLGVFILLYGMLAPGAELGSGEKTLIMLIALLPGIPGAYLVSRSFWAIFRVFETNEGPIQAVRASWQMSYGRGWYLLSRFILLGLYLILIMIIPAIVFTGLQAATGVSLFNVLLQITLSIAALPITNIYLYRIYRSLE